ncbi:hypothetical protein METP3_03027 [Methanosarcinales archaeon]|nr:hypothetical protein METP3_03027 [Methanosarcinales archaeon]
MNGKSIVFIGALAAGAYLLLSGSGGSGGGAEGGGTKKATAITGVVPGFDGGSGGIPPDSGGSVGESPGPSSPFQPSQYLMDLIYQKYNTPTAAEEMGLTPMSKKESSKLWSSDSSVSNILSGANSQGATVYTSPQPYDSRKVDYFVEIGDLPGQYNPTIPSKPPTLAQATTKDGINWTPVSKKESSSPNLSRFRQGGNANAPNTFAFVNGRWTNTAIPGSYRDPSTGTWHRD